jgi:hypothetical protein
MVRVFDLLLGSDVNRKQGISVQHVPCHIPSTQEHTVIAHRWTIIRKH